ncbi:MAG: hypothetical protein IGS49_16760 [Chlorogloeopsis fritschii C42_A2020_084]|nr:hypothetical protein [Chlorogloeopsis fritschii]MBF2007068.1 hypothetical protein [Chlorogloeopsis fritschii C42_A2020_084]
MGFVRVAPDFQPAGEFGVKSSLSDRIRKSTITRLKTVAEEVSATA